MDFLLQQNNIIIMLIAVVSGGMLLWPSLARGRAQERLAPAAAVQQINQGNGIFVDIRPHEQFKSGSIPQSRNIPLDTLESHAGSLPKDKPVVIVDANGREAGRAVAQLRKHGLAQVAYLEGGLGAWSEGGLPLKKS